MNLKSAMKSNIPSIRKRLGYSLVALFTISFGVFLVATDQVIKRDRLLRHERLVMATAQAVGVSIEKLSPGQSSKLEDSSYQKILNEFSATRVLVWLSRPGTEPLFPDVTSVDQFLGNQALLQRAGLNAPGMQKPRSFTFDGKTYFTCSMPLPGNQGVLRFLEDVGVSPSGRQENLIALFFIWIISIVFATIVIRTIMTRALDPLTKLGAVMDDISLRPSGVVSDELVSLDMQPLELQSIVLSYNLLVERLQGSWTKQLLFMRSISHELITPLTLIASSSNRLNRHLDNLSLSDRSLLNSITYEAKNGVGLVRDFVDLASSETGSLRLSLSPTKAEEIIANLSEELKPLEWGSRIVTTLSEDFCNDSPVFVNVNQERLRQCIINVLENGIKYSAVDKSVELTMSIHSNSLFFDVKDFGVGIPKSEYEVIFQPFSRGSSNTSEVSGSGVGLALVKQLVELMGGQIYVHSSSNQGTIMRFEFPVIDSHDS
jgi:signal transduction histidine kinase